ncbi:hypothetical protein ACFXG4_08470 [Nocardia sp. NPDC059246]|uniref:hypothetical protein n=1 Tax=unclassified Nocardia TaxID=2637762 RepID=UPI0036C794AB
MVKPGKQSARRLASAATRREEALEMFVQGSTYQQIADALDYCDRGAAYRAVQTALSETATRTAELADIARPVVLERLQRLWLPWFAKAMAGDAKAADLCMRMIDRYQKVTGLDRITIEATITGHSEIDAEIEQLMTQLRTPHPPELQPGDATP